MELNNVPRDLNNSQYAFDNVPCDLTASYTEVTNIQCVVNNACGDLRIVHDVSTHSHIDDND